MFKSIIVGLTVLGLAAAAPDRAKADNADVAAGAIFGALLGGVLIATIVDDDNDGRRRHSGYYDRGPRYDGYYNRGYRDYRHTRHYKAYNPPRRYDRRYEPRRYYAPSYSQNRVVHVHRDYRGDARRDRREWRRDLRESRQDRRRDRREVRYDRRDDRWRQRVRQSRLGQLDGTAAQLR